MKYIQWFCNKDVLGQMVTTLVVNIEQMYTFIKSLCCTHEANITWCVNYTKKNNKAWKV